MHTPIVTGVGHETDTTLVDYVSDHRANTPTGAVEAAVPDIHEVRKHIQDLKVRMMNASGTAIKHKRMMLERMAMSSVFRSPDMLYRDKVMKLDFLREKLIHSTTVADKNRVLLNNLRNRIVTLAMQESHTLKTKTYEKRTALLQEMNHALSQSETRLTSNEDALVRNMKLVLDSKRNELEKEMRLLDAYSPLKVLDRGYSIVTKDDKAVIDAKDLQKEDLVTLRFAKGSAQAKIEKIIEEVTHGKDQ